MNSAVNAHSQAQGRRNVSPLSMESNDSAFIFQYQNMGSGEPYAAAARPLHTSTPLAHPQHHSSSTDGSSGRAAHRTPSGSKSHSSNSSVARSNDGSYHSPAGSEAGGIPRRANEDMLQEHYRLLKSFLWSHGQKDMGAARPTRARDKLLRLSVTQFQELSTDVYDEMLRREDDRMRRGGSVPKYLLPRPTFHPKRNQARQKLSTLPPDRFRQLASDVFFELERRVPRFAAGNMDRSASPASSVASSQVNPTRNGTPNGMRGPGARGPPPVRPPRLDSAAESLYEPYHSTDDMNGRGNVNGNDYSRPLPKTFHSNTIVPNKSTMVEDDESEEDDAFALERVVNGFTRRTDDDGDGGQLDDEATRAIQGQIAHLQQQMVGLEDRLLAKDVEISALEASRRQREDDFAMERAHWDDNRSEMNNKLSGMQTETDRAYQSRHQVEADLHAHMELTVSELQNRLSELNSENDLLRKGAGSMRTSGSPDPDEWRSRCHDLQDELANQQKLTDDVRRNATDFLQEMRLLSAQSDAALEKEEQLRAQITLLEAEVDEWKTRYAKAKTQLRTLKASSIGLPLHSAALSGARQKLLSDTGLVHDIDVTNFQMAIDELLHAARSSGPAAPDATLDKMKEVVAHVRLITGDGGASAEFSGLPSPGEPNLQQLLLATTSSNNNSINDSTSGAPPALRARIARSANSLITAARNHAASRGLSPVSLLDAAADNLAAAVIEFLLLVGVRPTPTAVLELGQHPANNRLPRGGNDLEGDDSDTAQGNGFELLRPVAHVPGSVPAALPASAYVAAGIHAAAVKAPPKSNGWFARLRGDSHDEDDDDDNEGDEHGNEDGAYDSYR